MAGSTRTGLRCALQEGLGVLGRPLVLVLSAVVAPVLLFRETDAVQAALITVLPAVAASLLLQLSVLYTPLNGSSGTVPQGAGDWLRIRLVLLVAVPTSLVVTATSRL